MEEDWAAKSEELSKQITAEEQMWTRMGFHPGMIVIDARLIQFKVNTLVAAVLELGISEEQLDAMFKQKVLDQMKADRGMLMEQQAQQQRPDIAVARKPGLLGPNGQPFKI